MPTKKKTSKKTKKSAASERDQFNVRSTKAQIAAYRAAADAAHVSMAFWITSHLDAAAGIAGPQRRNQARVPS